MTSLPTATTSINNFEYKLELTAGNFDSWTRLTIPELGLIIEWYGTGSQYANVYIEKENKDEIRGYCGSTDNNVDHNLELPLTEAVYGSVSKVSSPQCDGKDAASYIIFEELESSFSDYDYFSVNEQFKYCEGSPQYRRRRSVNEDDPCNGDDPVKICSGILNTLSDCKKSLSDNEINSFMGNCQFDMCLDDRNGSAYFKEIIIYRVYSSFILKTRFFYILLRISKKS